MAKAFMLLVADDGSGVLVHLDAVEVADWAVRDPSTVEARVAGRGRMLVDDEAGKLVAELLNRLPR